MNILLYLLAISPALLICYFIYRLDRFDRESHQSLIICFVLGMLVTIPAIKVEELELLFSSDGPLSLGELIFSTFVLVAIGEEVFKALPLLFFAYPKKYFNEPFDGIVFAVMVAMGFAMVENLFYAYRFGMQTTLIRTFTAVPTHGALAVIMGYHVGLAKFKPDKKYTLIAIGFLQVVLIHGLYDFFILQEYNEDLMVITALVLTLSIYYAVRLIRKHQDASPFKPTAETQPIAATDGEELNEIAEAVMKDMEEE